VGKGKDSLFKSDVARCLERLNKANDNRYGIQNEKEEGKTTAD
jgi:hypothetical protein